MCSLLREQNILWVSFKNIIPSPMCENDHKKCVVFVIVQNCVLVKECNDCDYPDNKTVMKQDVYFFSLIPDISGKMLPLCDR